MEAKGDLGLRRGTAQVLEVEADFAGEGTRGDVMGAAEGGEEVVEGVVVREVDDGETGAPFVAVAVKQVVVAEGHVEKIPRLDARGIVIVVLAAGSWDFDEVGSELGSGAGAGGADPCTSGV